MATGVRRDLDDEMVQQRVALVAQEIQVQDRGVFGIPMKQGAIDADGVVIQPAVLLVNMKSIERPLGRGISHDLLIGFEEARVADAEWSLPAPVVPGRACTGECIQVEPADDEMRRLPGVAAAEGEIKLNQRRRVPGQPHASHRGAGELGKVMELGVLRMGA